VIKEKARPFVAASRDVKKSMDAIGEARMVMRVMPGEEARRMKTAVILIGHSLTADEVGWLTGVPKCTINSLKKGFGDSLRRPGRATEKPCEFVFSSSRLAAVSAVFVRSLRDAMVNAGKATTTLEGCGEEFLGALAYTENFYDAVPSSDRMNGRRLLMIGMDWVGGKLTLTRCCKCHSEHLKSTQVVQLDSGKATMGECPMCQLSAHKMTEVRRAAVADLQQRAQMIESAKQAPATRKPVVFDLE
jgi:hypothetical protein